MILLINTLFGLAAVLFDRAVTMFVLQILLHEALKWTSPTLEFLQQQVLAQEKTDVQEKTADAGPTLLQSEAIANFSAGEQIRKDLHQILSSRQENERKVEAMGSAKPAEGTAKADEVGLLTVPVAGFPIWFQ